MTFSQAIIECIEDESRRGLWRGLPVALLASTPIDVETDRISEN